MSDLKNLYYTGTEKKNVMKMKQHLFVDASCLSIINVCVYKFGFTKYRHTHTCNDDEI